MTAKSGDPKQKAISAIADARADLDKALDELSRLHAADPAAVAFTAHALNNYLTVTSATIELLTLYLENYQDQQVHVWLNGLQHATHLMSQTVTQLMTVSAGTNPKLEPDQMDLVKLIERGCDYYRRISEKKNTRIVFETELDSALVWADRVAVGAILDNLLSNAVKFSESGTTVNASVKLSQNHYVCSVRDEGPGLTETDLQNLFQKGVRLSAVPTAGEPSSGYGLAVARDLVTRLGGRIWCESTFGRGASFSFALPVYEPANQAS